MSKSVEQSVKHKLQEISKALKTPFNPLLDKLFLERFLVRVGKSSYADKLIFKGGLCLVQFLNLGRETKDIDFLLIQAQSHIEIVKQMIEEIASIDVGDNFVFSHVEITLLSVQQKKKSSYRAFIQGQLGQIKNKLTIDIGTGDIVDFQPLEIELIKAKKPLFEKNIFLNSYTPEYIFSEKLEAILDLGDSNSRMKDFYDCYRLIEENILDGELLKTAIYKTMKTRGTLLKMIPDSNEQFEKRWNSFIKKNKMPDLKLPLVIFKINQFLKTLMII